MKYYDTMLDMINNIVEVVANTYYYYVDYETKKDLMQQGYYKAYEMLRRGEYDPDQNLRNYIFTIVRNAMTNYMYHQKKEVHASYEIFNDNIEVESQCIELSQTKYTDCSYTVDIELIRKACLPYKDFGDYTGTVVQYFNSIGLDMSDIKAEVPIPSNIILNAIIVDVLYSL